jgi:hypothetical protein
MNKSFIGNVWQMDRNVFKLNKKYLACDRRTDMKKKMRRGVFSKNIWKWASE